MQFDNTKKILCYCTVCISGLIDDFFGLGGGGGSPKKLLLLGGGGAHGKNLMTGGSCNFLMTVQKIPPAPSPLPHKKLMHSP